VVTYGVLVWQHGEGIGKASGGSREGERATTMDGVACQTSFIGHVMAIGGERMAASGKITWAWQHSENMRKTRGGRRDRHTFNL